MIIIRQNYITKLLKPILIQVPEENSLFLRGHGTVFDLFLDHLEDRVINNIYRQYFIFREERTTCESRNLDSNFHDISVHTSVLILNLGINRFLFVLFRFSLKNKQKKRPFIL